MEGTAIPAEEYTTKHIVCRTSGGNPSDPSSFTYEWMYKSTYGPPTTDVPVSHGIQLIDLY